jgi:DNA-binding SARP family transcriptional activator
VSISLRLLGAFSLQVDGEERGTAVPSRAATLLAHLVVDPGAAHARPGLAFRLWPDSTEGQARTNLRNVVHHLRRAVPEVEEVVEITSTHLRWVGAPGCRVDVVDVLAAADAADAAGNGSPERVESLRAVVAGYAGDLLAGVDDESIDGERARLRDRFVRALRDLTAMLVQSDPREATQVGRELVRRDPLNEEHHRLLIAAHAAAGDRAGAVRAYHECVDVLRQELGVGPSTGTLDAYRQLVDDTTLAPGTEHRSVAPTAGSTPLVGRSTELAELSSRWAEAAAGHPNLVLVAGEPGVGKTRLVEELASDVARRGAVVGRARSYLSEGELGYGVVTDWLRTPEISATLTRASAADRTELARLLPELAGHAPPPAGPAGEGGRLRLFEAIERTLASINRPMLLIADDAHWCDAASLQLLHYVLRSTSAPVLVAATARREDVGDEHLLTTVTDALRVLDRATVIGVERLTVAETGELAEALGAAALESDAIARLHHETEGNPLFVVEAVRAGWDANAGSIDLSPKLQAVISARLAQLSETARAVLYVAATAGRAFTADLIGRVTGLDELALVQGLDELWRRGVIEGHEPESYDFTHGKIREAAYSSLSPAIRSHDHLRIAEALVATSGDRDAASGVIAAHFDRGGRPHEAVRWYQRAAGHALKLGAHPEAIHIVDRALELVRQLPAADALPMELDLLGLQPPALSGVDGYTSDRVLAIQQRAITVATKLGVELEPPMLRSLAMSSLCRDEFEDAEAAALRLHEAGRTGGDGGLELESTYLLGVIAFWSGRLETALERFTDVVARFDPERHPDHIVRFGQDPRPVCLSRLANTLWFRGFPDEAITARDEALDMVEGVREFITTEVVHIFGAMLSLDLDDHDTYRRCARHFADGSDRAGVHLLMAEALLGYLDVLDGNADRGLRRIRTSFERCGGRNPAPSVQSMVLRLLVGAHAATGDHTGGLAATDLALALGGTRLWEPEVRRLRARFLAARGAPGPEIAAQLDEASAAATRIGAPGAAARVDATRHALLRG